MGLMVALSTTLVTVGVVWSMVPSVGMVVGVVRLAASVRELLSVFIFTSIGPGTGIEIEEISGNPENFDFVYAIWWLLGLSTSIGRTSTTTLPYVRPPLTSSKKKRCCPGEATRSASYSVNLARVLRQKSLNFSFNSLPWVSWAVTFTRPTS